MVAETRVPGGNPCRLGENMQIAETGFEHQTFLLWGSSTSHSASATLCKLTSIYYLHLGLIKVLIACKRTAWQWQEFKKLWIDNTFLWFCPFLHICTPGYLQYKSAASISLSGNFTKFRQCSPPLLSTKRKGSFHGFQTLNISVFGAYVHLAWTRSLQCVEWSRLWGLGHF